MSHKSGSVSLSDVTVSFGFSSSLNTLSSLLVHCDHVIKPSVKNVVCSVCVASSGNAQI